MTSSAPPWRSQVTASAERCTPIPRHSSTSIHHQPAELEDVGTLVRSPADRAALHPPRRQVVADRDPGGGVVGLVLVPEPPAAVGAVRDARVDDPVGAQRDLADRRASARGRRSTYSTMRRAWPSQRSGMPSMTVRYMRYRSPSSITSGAQCVSVPGAELEARHGSRVRQSSASAERATPIRDSVHPGDAGLVDRSPVAACRTSTTRPCRGGGSRSDRSRRRAPGRGRARRQAWRRSVTGLSRLRRPVGVVAQRLGGDHRTGGRRGVDRRDDLERARGIRRGRRQRLARHQRA